MILVMLIFGMAVLNNKTGSSGLYFVKESWKYSEHLIASGELIVSVFFFFLVLKKYLKAKFNSQINEIIKGQ